MAEMTRRKNPEREKEEEWIPVEPMVPRRQPEEAPQTEPIPVPVEPEKEPVPTTAWA